MYIYIYIYIYINIHICGGAGNGSKACESAVDPPRYSIYLLLWHKSTNADTKYVRVKLTYLRGTQFTCFTLLYLHVSNLRASLQLCCSSVAAHAIYFALLYCVYLLYWKLTMTSATTA